MRNQVLHGENCDQGREQAGSPVCRHWCPYYILFLPGAGWDRPNAERWLKNQVPGRCDGALKLFHSVNGNIPRIINAIWLAANNTSHLNTASVKP